MAKYIPGIWENRSSTNTNRRSFSITDVGDSGLTINTTFTADVTRADTSVTEAGTPFNKSTMDSFENRIKTAFDKCLGYKYFSVNSSSGIYLSNEIRNYPLLELFYSNGNGTDGIYSKKIYIQNYAKHNRICLDSISCGSNNKFYFKKATYDIHNYGTQVWVQRLTNITKKLVYENGSFHSEDYNNIDLVIYYIIGYSITA